MLSIQCSRHHFIAEAINFIAIVCYIIGCFYYFWVLWLFVVVLIQFSRLLALVFFPCFYRLLNESPFSVYLANVQFI